MQYCCINRTLHGPVAQEFGGLYSRACRLKGCRRLFRALLCSRPLKADIPTHRLLGILQSPDISVYTLYMCPLNSKPYTSNSALQSPCTGRRLQRDSWQLNSRRSRLILGYIYIYIYTVSRRTSGGIWEHIGICGGIWGSIAIYWCLMESDGVDLYLQPLIQPRSFTLSLN